jgi:hypothetical protein
MISKKSFIQSLVCAFGPIKGTPEPERGKRPCLNCEAPHYHHNSFCSATCAKRYKSGKKNEVNNG